MSILIRRLYVPLAVLLSAALLAAVSACAGDGLTVRHDGADMVVTMDGQTARKKVDLPAGGNAFFKIDLQQDTEAGSMQCANHFGEILLASEFGTEGTVETSAVTPVIRTVF